jgi:tetratricopeptide (TPR) repeat protein
LAEHIDETELSLYAADSEAVPPERRAAIQRHTANCGECRARLDFFFILEEDLRDPGVWEPFTGSPALASLRACAEQIATEDSEAEELLQKFLASPATLAATNLAVLGKRYVNGGVVRRLSTHAHEVCESEPLDALIFAEAAVTIAELLPEDTYPAKAVFELRGTAWKECANAQMVLGQFPDALESLNRAERAYRKLASPALGLSIVALVRAGVLYEQQKLDEAAAQAEAAEVGFANIGDDDRRIRALHLRGSIKLEAGDLLAAISLYKQALEYGEILNDPLWIGRALYAIGHCETDLNRLADASMHFHNALVIFREFGPTRERLCAEWGIARVIMRGGKRAQGLQRLRDLAAEFNRQGMLQHEALVGLDIAEGLLSLGEVKQIVDLATRLFATFKDSETLPAALSALAYLKEAAALKKLTPRGINAVRQFLKRSERQPELVFSPPADDFH